MSSKDKLPLLIGIGLPVLLILYILFVTYIPSLYAKPAYDFIYAQNCSYEYTIHIVGSKIIADIRDNYNIYQTNPLPADPGCLYLYDVHTDSSRQISLSEADMFSINSSTKSPDGYTVEKDTEYPGGVFPLFWYGGGDTGYYLTGHGLHRGIANSSYDFQFLGWISP